MDSTGSRLPRLNWAQVPSRQIAQALQFAFAYGHPSECGRQASRPYPAADKRSLPADKLSPLAEKTSALSDAGPNLRATHQNWYSFWQEPISPAVVLPLHPRRPAPIYSLLIIFLLP